MSLRVNILNLLAQAPQGLTAKDLARALNCETSDVNPLLYGDPASFLKRDDHCWLLREHATGKIRSDQGAANATPVPSTTAPKCPVCGGEMMARTARRGANAGGQFFGCKGYPACKGTVSMGEGAGASPAVAVEPPPDLGESPLCPKCNQPMSARRSRQGSWFWGCPSYPKCRGTRPLHTTENDDNAADASTLTWTSQNRPRAMHAAPHASTHRLLLVEGAAVPKGIVRRVGSALTEPLRRAVSQWRLELPLDLPTGNGQVPSWLTVARALLRRGRIMPMSEPLAEHLRILVGANVEWSERELQQAAACLGDLARAATSTLESAESDEEADFYTDVLGVMVGPHSRGWVLSQVLIGSLTGDPTDLAANQRADFTVLHPRGLHLVVEIDGQQHAQQREQDEARDRALASAGFEVVRVPAEQVRQRTGAALMSLVERLRSLPAVAARDLPPLARWLLLCKRAHQIQLAVLEWLATARLSPEELALVHVEVVLDDAVQSLIADPVAFVAAVLEDLSALSTDICSARGEAEQVSTFVLRDGADIRLRFDFNEATRPDTAYIADAYVPVPISAGLPKGVTSRPGEVSESGCERVLTRLFGFSAFREGQFEAIKRALNGLDSVVLLPTGSGKSVAFQLAALLRSGVCMVVDPILSLIDDQIDNLQSAGIDRVIQITGNLSAPQRSEFLDLMKRGEFLFCYVAPERFQDDNFRSSLLTMTAHTPVALVAIDEAHCVSEWGHDFRTAYLNLARNARHYCRSSIGVPPLMALTGTASHSVLKDVQRELGIAQYEAIITPRTFDRPELTFEVFPCRSDEKTRKLHGILLGLPEQFALSQDRFFEPAADRTAGGLLFCPHTNGDHGVVEVASCVASLLQRPVPFYSGQAPKGFATRTWTSDKRRTAMGFKRNEFPLMACTKAFGMGIDKPNIRYTIHFNLPASIESFYQEAGRAGRDRRKARCAVLFANDDPQRSQHLLSPATEVEDVRDAIDNTKRPASDDITRMLYFHINSFRGIEEEMAGIDDAIEALGDLTRARRVAVPFDRESQAAEERAIHRLVVLGVVRDYTVDYSAKEFGVAIAGSTRAEILDHFYRYLAAYQRQRASATIRRAREWLERPYIAFVRSLAEEMIEFVYDVIERGRRRNLSEMLRILEDATEGEDVRRGILDYLEKSRFSQSINELPSLDSAGVFGVCEIVANIRSSIDAAEVRGESARALGAYPDYPGLLLLRAASEALTSHPDTNTIVENAKAAAHMSHVKYDLPPLMLYDATLRCVLMLADDRPEMACALLSGIFAGGADRRAGARWMLAQHPGRLTAAVTAVLMNELRSSVLALAER